MAEKKPRLKFKPLPTQERLRELLNYNPETGALTWRISTNNRVSPGDKFGCLNKAGHQVGHLDGTVYVAHRLIWRWMTGDDPILGDDPTMEVDHENTIGSDNRWSNLRLATSSQNNGNIKANRRNTTGFKGVTVHKPSGKFFVKIAKNGKQHYIGLFVRLEDAADAYMAKARELFGEFARAA